MYEYYEILGVDRDADGETIEAAFRERVRELHPDQDGDRAELVQLKRARAVLTDSAQRKDYDRLGHREFVERERSVGPADVDLRSGKEPRQATAEDSRRRTRGASSVRSRSRSSGARESGPAQDAPTGTTGRSTERSKRRGDPDHRRAAADQEQEQSHPPEPSAQPSASDHESVVDLDEVADVGDVDPDKILDDADPLTETDGFDDSNTAAITDDGEAGTTNRGASRDRAPAEETDADSDEQSSRTQQPTEPTSSPTAQSAPQNQAARPNQTRGKSHSTDETSGQVTADHNESRATSPTPPESATPARDPAASDQPGNDAPSSEQAQPSQSTDSVSATPDGRNVDDPSETADPAAFGTTQTGSGQQPIEAATETQNGSFADDLRDTPSDSVGDGAAKRPESNSVAEDESHAAGGTAAGFEDHGEEPPSTEEEWTAANSGNEDPSAGTGANEWDSTTDSTATEDPSGTASSTGPDSFGMAEATETDGGTQSSPGVVHRIVAPLLAVPGAITGGIPFTNISGAVGRLRATVRDDYRTEEVEQMAAYAWLGRVGIAAALWVPLALLAPDAGIIPSATGAAVGVGVLSITVSFLLYDLLLRYGADLTPGCHGPVSTAPPVRGVGGLVVLYIAGLIAVGAAVLDAPTLRSLTTSSVTLSTVETTVRTAPYHAGIAVVGAGTAVAAFSTLAVVWWYLPWSDRFDHGYRVLPGWWQLPVPVAGLLVVWTAAGGTATLPGIDVAVDSNVVLGIVGALPVVTVLYLVWRTLREPEATTTW